MVAEKAAIKASNTFTKIVSVSPALKKFLGVGESSRSDITKRIWAYAKENKLQVMFYAAQTFCNSSYPLQSFDFREVLAVANMA